MNLTTELSHIKIEFTDKTNIENYVLLVQPIEMPTPSSMDSPNIFVITIDEASAAHFKRKLRASYQYLTETLKVIEFNKHAAVSESTHENMMALLAGKEFTTF